MEAAHGCDLMLCVGSTLSVYPVARHILVEVESGSGVVSPTVKEGEDHSQ